MASAVVVFGKLAGGEAILSANFVSQSVASGAVSTASPAGQNYCVVTPVGGAMYVALTSDANVTPNAAAHPHIPTSDGVGVTFNIKPGTKVSVADV